MEEKLTYEQAYAELETIMTALQNDEVSIDDLEAKVKRATTLIEHCSSKLRNTEISIKNVLKDIGEE